MRWGIFWRRLTFGIGMCGDIIIASMFLHNFIIDHRIVDNDTNYLSNFNVSEEDMFQNASFLGRNVEDPLVLTGDNDEPRSAGRINRDMKACQEIGEQLRDTYQFSLAINGFERPARSNHEQNKSGHSFGSY